MSENGVGSRQFYRENVEAIFNDSNFLFKLNRHHLMRQSTAFSFPDLPVFTGKLRSIQSNKKTRKKDLAQRISVENGF